MGSLIDVADDGRVRCLTLNRPKQLNALNTQLLETLADEIGRAAGDTSIGCLIIRGAGERAFSAGADLDEIRGLTAEQAQAFIRNGHRAMSAVERSPVPVIAAVDGYALGGGFELMLACHIVLASDRSRLGLPEARIGCIPGFGGTQRLGRAVGKAAAYHLMLTGDRIDARRAWELGLLSVPPIAPDALHAEALRTAQRVASGSRPGLTNLLESAHQALRPAALEHEAALAAIAIASAHGQEGISAFAERREPVFQEEPSR